MKLTLFLGIFLMAAQSFALPKYVNSFKTTYPQFKKAACVLCHINSGINRNLYGAALEKTSHQTGAPDFKSIEQLDSDEDQYTNIEEISAGSMPGDKDSTPSRP